LKRFAIVIIMLLCASAFAGEADKKGFSGYLDAGIVGISSNDALMTSGKNEDIDNTSDSPDRFSKALLTATFLVNYNNGKGIDVYLGTPAKSIKPQIALGMKNETPIAKTDLSVIFNPLSKVWKNPYASDREKTSAASAGIKLSLKEIGGTPHMLEIKIIGHNIDNDVIGRQYSELKRDGVEYEISYGYSLPVSTGVIRPYINGKYDDRLGEAESSKGTGAGVLLLKHFGKDLLVANASLEYSKFDEENPYFGETRKELESVIFAKYKLQDPFGWKNKHFSFSAGVMNRASNVDFYDAVTYLGSVTFGIDF